MTEHFIDRTFWSAALLTAAAAIAGCYSPPEARNSGPETNYASNRPNADRTPLKANSNMSNENKKPEDKTGFAAHLPDGFAQPKDSVEKTLLREYGAVFVAQGVTVPTKIVFKDEAEVAAFQSTLRTASETIGGFKTELQTAAMDELRKAMADAKAQGLSITPRGDDSARRSYNETVSLWKSRVDPALKHWVANGKMTQAEADRIAGLSTYEQVEEVLKLEEKGIYFAKDLSKSIIYSVAPPGTSQHLSMLALDVSENNNDDVRAILARHKWFQTVVSDLPHFTYLGVDEKDLPSLGLKKTSSGGRTFWVPDI